MMIRNLLSLFKKPKYNFVFSYHLILLIFFSNLFYAQEVEVLQKKLLQVESKHEKAELLLKLSSVLNRSYPDSAFVYANRVLKVSKELSDLKLEVRSCKQIGYYYFAKGKTEKAIEWYKEGLEICENNNYNDLKPGLLLNLGAAYAFQNRHDIALDYYFKSETVAKKYNRSDILSLSIHNIGAMLYEQDRFREALLYFFKGLKIESDQTGMECLNVSQAYQKIGMIDSAFYYTNISLDFAKKYKSKFTYAEAYNSLGSLYEKTGNYELAEDYLLKSIHEFDLLSNKLLTLKPILILAKLYKDRLNDTIKAEYYYKMAENIIIDNDRHDKGLQTVYLGLGKIYIEQKRFNLANEYLLKRIELDEEVYLLKKDKAIADIQARYDLEKKDNEIALHKLQLKESENKYKTKRNYLVISVVSLMLLIGLLLTIYGKEKLKNKLLEEEKVLQSRLSQISVKNRLQEERIRISRDLHDNIGAHLSFIISSINNILFIEDMSQKEMQKGIEEVKDFSTSTISLFRDTIWALNDDAFTMSEFKKRLSVFIANVERSQNNKVQINLIGEICNSLLLNPIQTINLFRIIQESINNAVKYSKSDTIDVSFYHDDRLFIEIKDYGVGFDMSKITYGNGLENIKRRIEQLKGDLSIVTTNKGTTIRVSIPIINIEENR